MSFELFVAWRYLRAKRRGLFAAITSVIGVAGVTIGVAALITTMSVMNGFQTDIEQKVIGAQAHITIYGLPGAKMLAEAQAVVEKDPDVAAVSRFSLGQAILSFQGRTLGIAVKGLNPETEFKVNDLAKTLREGSWSNLTGAKLKHPGIVLGQELARNLGVWTGDEVVLISPKGLETPFGLMPKMEKFTVAGLLHTGYYEYDSTMGYLSLPVANAFFSIPSGATGLGLRLYDLDKVDSAARRLSRELGPEAYVRTYSQMNSTLFAALKLEKGVMFIILALIVLVASLNIASTLILRSVEKTREIGLLKAMGATPRQIRRIFLAEGFIIGGFGLACGLALGFFLCWFIKTYPIVQLPADIYYLTQVPVSIQTRDVLAVLGLGLLLSLLATVYPAAQAAQVDPVEAIHYG